jgi:transketolase
VIQTTPRVSQRTALAEAFKLLGAEYPDLVVLSPDTSRTTGAREFRDRYPGRFFCTGVSEMNTLGLAAGLALEGWRPLVAGMAMFVAGKAWEPMRQCIAYPGLDVKIVATHAGISVGPDGVTHQAVEDLALMRAVPGMTVLAPTDAAEVLPAIRAALAHRGPVYVRLERHEFPVVTDASAVVRLGGSTLLRRGDDVALFGVGSMAVAALEAADILAADGIEARVIGAVSVKPLDTAAAEAAARQTGAIVAAEDHNRHGGLGSAIAEALVASFPVPLEQVALDDRYAESGETDELRARHGMTPADIAEAARRAIRRRDAGSGAGRPRPAKGGRR